MKSFVLSSILSLAVLASNTASAEEPCLGGLFGGFQVKCHTEKGFKIGCVLTKEQIVLFRELVDANLPKKGYVHDLTKVGNSVAFSYGWNGVDTDYYTYWNEEAGVFEALATLN